jgi:hypothetical protein
MTHIDAIADHLSVLTKERNKYHDIAEKCKRKVYLYEQKTEDGRIYRG